MQPSAEPGGCLARGGWVADVGAGRELAAELTRQGRPLTSLDTMGDYHIYGNLGLALASVLSPEVLLLVLVSPQANIGQLLLEVRRNREHIAALV